MSSVSEYCQGFTCLVVGRGEAHVVTIPPATASEMSEVEQTTAFAADMHLKGFLVQSF